MGKVYAFTGFTGGAATDLDSLDGDLIIDDDMAFVKSGDMVFLYNLNSTSSATENSPLVIAPNDNAGAKRWELQSVATADLAYEHSYAGGSATTTMTGINLFAETIILTNAGASADVVCAGLVGKKKLLLNKTTKGMTLKTSAGATGVTINSGQAAWTVHDGTDYVQVTSGWVLV
jgi:hypothetical protein